LTAVGGGGATLTGLAEGRGVALDDGTGIGLDAAETLGDAVATFDGPGD
jgi:hypothetical protein